MIFCNLSEAPNAKINAIFWKLNLSAKYALALAVASTEWQTSFCKEATISEIVRVFL